MSKCILSPSYGDMSTVILGSSVKTIKKTFKKHWKDVLDFPEDYSKDYVEQVKKFLDKEHQTIDEIKEDYSKNFDEDYSFEED